MTNQRKNITNPSDHWDAFELEAKRRNLSLSAFSGLAMMRLLSRDVREGLSERKSVGAPKHKGNENG